MNNKIKTIILSIILFIIIIPAVYHLFSPYIMGTADGMAHKFRLTDFHKSLSEGNLRPRWISGAALGFGAPIFLFNYSLPYYVADIFIRLGFSINISSAIMQAIFLILSFIFMFLFAKKLWGFTPGLMAAITYLYAPYHLFMVYSYEAWGEIASYMFPPLILYLIQIYMDSIKNKNIKSNFCTLSIVLCVMSWVLFILSHNVSAMISAPMILLLAWTAQISPPTFFSAKAAKAQPGLKMDSWGKRYGIIIWTFILTVLISAFFIIPAVSLYKNIKYPELISREIGIRKINFKSVGEQITTAYNVIKTGFVRYYEFTVGFPILLAGFGGVLYLPISFIILRNRRNEKTTNKNLLHSSTSILNKQQKNSFSVNVLIAVSFFKKLFKKIFEANKIELFDNFFIGLLIILAGSLFLANPASNNIWDFQLLHYVVYPYRFLFTATFAGSLLIGWWFKTFNRIIGSFLGQAHLSFHRRIYLYWKDVINVMIFLSVVILILISGFPYTRPSIDIFPFKNEYFSSVQPFTNASGTLKNIASYEFLPRYINKNFLEKEQDIFFQTGKPLEKFILNADEGKLIESNIKSENIKARIKADKNLFLTVNTSYFPNWEAKLDGRPSAVSQDSVGRITILIPKGIHDLELIFGYVKEEIIGFMISGIGILLMITTIIRLDKDKN